MTFASLVMPDRKGHRVQYVNGDRRDLRRSNLSYQRGRGRAYERRHNVPDPRKGGRKVLADYIPDDIDSAQRKELMVTTSTQPWELSLATDFSEMTLDEILALEEFEGIEF